MICHIIAGLVLDVPDHILLRGDEILRILNLRLLIVVNHSLSLLVLVITDDDSTSLLLDECGFAQVGPER